MSELLNEVTLLRVQTEVKNKYPKLFLDAFTSKHARDKLFEILLKKQKILEGDIEKVKYAVQELVGLGVIEDIINENEAVTDISFNGTELIVNTNVGKFKYEGLTKVSENYINKIIQKFANAVGKEFTPKDPILDASLNNLRINAVHKEISPYGTTMALRVTRPKLALNRHNFSEFAPLYMYDFLRAAILAKSNVIFSGEVGCGKTEAQKLAMSFIPFEDKICLVEDVVESHAKELFSDKDVHSWLTTSAVSYSDLIRAGLRNNPAWIIIAETRGKEAYEMIQSVLSGHRIITTLHAINARAIPSRFVNMANMGYNIDERSLLADLYRYFDFGVHLEKIEWQGKVIRFLSEVVEFDGRGTAHTVFKQWITPQGLKSKSYSYSQDFSERLIKYQVKYVGLPKAGEAI